ISMWMPWANWVALKWKPIETRTHERFRGLVGKKIGIHAAVKWDNTAIEQARLYLIPEQIRQTRGMLRLGGGIICTAFVEAFRELTEADEWQALIECKTKRYGLFLRDVTTIEYIPCRGRQGIWYVDRAETEGLR